MESQSLGAIMKKFLLNLYEKSQKLTFMQGVVLTVTLTSLVSIASTVLPNGLFSFAPGTPISSSEINANFEKLSSAVGTVVLKASYSSAISVNQSSFITPSDCSTCKVNRKRIKFSTIAIGALQDATDTDSNSSTNSSPFSYYQVQESGWYEIRLLANTFATINAPTTCDAYGCDINVNSSVSVNFADNLSQAQTSSTGSIGWSSAYQNLRDDNDNNGINNDDGVFDSVIPYPAYPPEIKRYYLKSGQILFVRFEGNYNVRDVTPNITVGLNSLDLTVIKL